VTSTLINTLVEVTANGADAFDVMGNGDTLLVTSTGTLASMGGGNGITASGNFESVTVDGLAYGASGLGVSMNGIRSTLVVDGEAQGNAGVQLANGAASDSVYVGAQGQVTGLFSGFYLVDTDAQIVNDGHVFGSEYGIDAFSSSGDTITNDGVISNPGAAAFADSAAITLSLSTSESVDNVGLISAPQAIYVEEGSTAAIRNSGTILGTLTVTDTAQVTVDNSGTWHGTALDLDSSANNVLTNSGKIHGTISFGDGNNTFTSSDIFTGSISFGGGDNTLTNSGASTGTVSFGSGDNAFANSGTLTGAVSFGSGTDTLTNSGTITGNIVFEGATDQLTNDGLIHGSISMGHGDTLINTGTIHGSVYLGVSNEFLSNGGEVTGALVANPSDLFDFSGTVGHVTIDGFVSTGTTHDVIHFGNDDFANYAALQADMTQVGRDVVITLDASDSIVLGNTTLAHLVSHDFTFGS
jgi:hypothetical protein